MGDKLMSMPVKEILAKIKKHKDEIAKQRDILNGIYIELGSCLDSFDFGIEGLEEGKREIETALDSISEHV